MSSRGSVTHINNYKQISYLHTTEIFFSFYEYEAQHKTDGF